MRVRQLYMHFVYYIAFRNNTKTKPFNLQICIRKEDTIKCIESKINNDMGDTF